MPKHMLCKDHRIGVPKSKPVYPDPKRSTRVLRVRQKIVIQQLRSLMRGLLIYLFYTTGPRTSLSIQSVCVPRFFQHHLYQHPDFPHNHASTSPTPNIPIHPPHHAPNPSHRLRPITRIEKIKPFRAFHVQNPPFLRRRVEPLLLGTTSDEIEVAVIDADVNDGEMVVDGGDEVDLEHLSVEQISVN